MIVTNRTDQLASALLTTLRHETGNPELAFAGTPTALTGGFWAELFSFQLSGAPQGWDVPLVARVMPDAGIAAKETVFQAEVAAQGFPTPAVRLSGDPAHGIEGHAFMVMGMANGQPLLAGLDGIGALNKLPALARRVPALLANTLAALHRVNPESVSRRLEAVGVSNAGLDAMLRSLRETADALGRPDLAAAATWLDEHPLTPAPDVICHGDMHPFNVLDDNGTTTVLDWSAALIAPATYDLGFTSLVLAEPPLLVPQRLRPIIRAAGRALSRRFIRAYERDAGRSVDSSALAWHQGLICLRALTEVAGWVTAGTVDGRDGHPWIIAGPALAGRLSRLTGIHVAPR